MQFTTKPKSKWRVAITWLIVIGILIVILLSPVWLMFYSIWKAERAIRSQERTMLKQIDPAKLYAASMQVLKEKLDTDDPTDQKLPSEIRALAPHGVVASDNFVRIELGGGFHHFGFNCFPPGTTGYGTKQLISGLWYDDENGFIPSSN